MRGMTATGRGQEAGGLVLIEKCAMPSVLRGRVRETGGSHSLPVSSQVSGAVMSRSNPVRTAAVPREPRGWVGDRL